MRKLRSLRRLIALATLVGWGLLQVAVTAYACPIGSPDAVVMAAMAADPVDTSDVAPPCAEHCATQHSVGSPALPGAMPAFAIQPSIRVAPATTTAEAFDSARQHSERRTARGDSVPILLELQVFRE